jgi:hypothetical protein
VVLHEILFGKNTFRGDNQAATLNRVLNHKPDLIEPIRPDVPKGLDAALQKGLAKAPKDRHANAREFAAALRALQREPESDLRARLASLLKEDFGQDMAEMLGLESLADRDEAWRRLSHYPPTRVTQNDLIEQISTGNGSDGVSPTTRPRTPQGTLRGPPPPPSDPTAVRVPRNSGSARRVQESGRAIAVPPPPPPSSLRPPQPSGTLAVPGALLQPEPARQRTVPAFLAGLVVAAALVIAALLAVQREPPANATTPRPQIRVVTDTQPVESARLPDALEASGDAGLRRTAERPGDDGREDNVRTPRERGSKPDALILTRAFRKQHARIETCFAQHAVEVEGMAQMQVEFDLAASGRVEGARVMPAVLAKTALGKCLEQIATSTHFPPQGQAVSFAIPLTASRSASR